MMRWHHSLSFSRCICLADNFVAIVLRFCGSLFVHFFLLTRLLFSRCCFFSFCFLLITNPSTHSFVVQTPNVKWQWYIFKGWCLLWIFFLLFRLTAAACAWFASLQWIVIMSRHTQAHKTDGGCEGENENDWNGRVSVHVHVSFMFLFVCAHCIAILPKPPTELSYNKWFSGVYFSHSWRRFPLIFCGNAADHGTYARIWRYRLFIWQMFGRSVFFFVAFVYFMSCIVISFSPFSIVIIPSTRRVQLHCICDDCVYELRIVSVEP